MRVCYASFSDGAGVVLVCVVVFAIIIGGAFFLTQGVADAGDTFMTALQENRLDDAYTLFAPNLKNEVDSEVFAGTFSNWNLESWNFSSRSVDNNQGQLSGTATINGDLLNVELNFEKIGDNWLLIGYDFSPTS